MNGRVQTTSMQHDWDDALVAAGREPGLRPEEVADQAGDDLDRYATR